MSGAGLGGWSLGVGLVGVAVLKTAVGFGGFSGEFKISASICSSAREAGRAGRACQRLLYLAFAPAHLTAAPSIVLPPRC